MGLIVEHSRDGALHFAKCVFLNDNEGYTCRSKVLLSTAVDDRVLANVNRAREDVARHVSYHWHVYVVVGVNLSTVDGVVGGDMEVFAVVGNGVSLRDVGVVVGLR